jgi:hypothetical protein
VKRRTAIRNFGVIAGGVLVLPYACTFSAEMVYKNFPLVKLKEQELIGKICNCILAEDPINFPTPESRIQFVLTMINDCGSQNEISILIGGLEAFESALSPTHETDFNTLTKEEQSEFIEIHFKEKTLVTDFLNLMKKYSLLHFESSENYLTQYLNFEFMPGRYFGRVTI